jgi:hypothetical protein
LNVQPSIEIEADAKLDIRVGSKRKRYDSRDDEKAVPPMNKRIKAGGEVHNPIPIE